MLTLVPIAMIFSKAPLDTMKTATVITALPFIVIILIQTYGLVKWLKEDYGHIPSHVIDEQNLAADHAYATELEQSKKHSDLSVVSAVELELETVKREVS